MQKTQPRFENVTDDTQIEQTARLADEIWHECYAEILRTEQIDYMVENIQSCAAIKNHIQTCGYEYYLIYLGDTAVGYTAVQIENGHMLLSKLYVLAAHRGKGIAHTCMAFTQQLARKRQCSTLWLTVNKYNERAIAVYEKSGFTLVRSQTVDIGGGFVMDDYVFEKKL